MVRNRLCSGHGRRELTRGNDGGAPLLNRLDILTLPEGGTARYKNLGSVVYKDFDRF